MWFGAKLDIVPNIDKFKIYFNKRKDEVIIVRIWRMMMRIKINSKLSSVGGSASGGKSQSSKLKAAA
jgi:hypothetical protein